MRIRDLLLMAGLGVQFAIAGAAGQAQENAPFHPSGFLKPPEVSNPSASKPAVAQLSSLANLTKIVILPSSISITGPHYSQRLLVEGTFLDGHQEDLTSRATVTISNAGVGILSKDHVLSPVADGHAAITATLRGHQATAQFTVSDYGTATTWSFRNDVIPVMTKVGCNSGPCHGAAAGKNGFKLSLRGYDPITDYYTLTHQALGRRTDRIQPARSLILLKPTATIPHGGGRRFGVDSPEYRVMSGWIAQGMPEPRETDALVKEIRVLPEEASLTPG